MMTMTKEKISLDILECNKCGLGTKVLNKVVARGTSEHPMILFIGEAPGSEENKTGHPFVGRSGKVLDGMIDYMGIKSYVIVNRLKCFINSKVMIYTSEGYKFITNVQVGDLVLTHKGRFRKVLSRIHDLPKEERMNIEKLYRIKTHHKNYVLPSSHRFLFLSGEWIEVGKLKQGDKIKVLGEKCIICGKIYWKNPERFDFADNTCSPYCHNISISKKPSFGKSISKAMFKSYQEGTRDKFEITKRANNATRKKVKNGTFHLLSKNTNPKHRKKQRLSASKSFQGFNEMKIKKGVIGLGEIELSEWLLSKKINFISQYSVENYNYDFFLPEHNLIIEVENPVAETQKVRIDRRNVKEKFIHIKTNHDIVYLHSDRIIEETERVLKNHDGKYYFCETEIIKIEEFHSDRNQYLYSLEIEEDESFIAGGIVHHNCQPFMNSNPTPVQLKECHPFLLRQIEYYDPTLIILLGRFANKGFGPKLEWGDIQFYNDRYYCKLYHPAALLYQSKNRIPQEKYMDKIKKMMMED